AGDRLDVVRLDRQDRSLGGLLLPHPEPGDPDRVRPPDAGEPAPARGESERPEPRAHPRRGADAERQRLREGSAAPALRAALALVGVRYGAVALRIRAARAVTAAVRSAA